VTDRAETGAVSERLAGRAAAVIPGGLWGHQHTRFLTPDHPQFIAESSGARFTDVDGRGFIDLMCAWGPMILGYRDPVVDAAAAAQSALGDTQNGPAPVLVDFCELLVDTIDHADWTVLAKNGTDATTACLTIARAETGRDVVLLARGCYHGAAPWATPIPVGVTAGDRAALDYFEYNDADSFAAAVGRAGDRLAGVMVTPFKHIEGVANEDVDPEFARLLRRTCDATGTVLILDDVRCGFRLNVGGSWEPLGIRPDLSAWSKALANGYALAAVVGVEGLRESAESVFLTGSFWTGAVSIAAGRATLEILREGPAFERMTASGERLRKGIEAQIGALENTKARYTGPVTMPYVVFDDDGDHERIEAFATACLRHGLYLHPRHNWFLSAAHDEAVVDASLAATAAAFSEVDAAVASGRLVPTNP
jgi:glutamate-1-semialdehyde 2,1-aminomutase